MTVFTVSVVFSCQNNQYVLSEPTIRRSPAPLRCLLRG